MNGPSIPTSARMQTPSEEGSIPRLRTFKDDLAEIIKTEHISTVQVAAAEQEKRTHSAKEAEVLSDEMKREIHDTRVRRITVTVATVLVVVGLSIGIGLYFSSLPSSAPEGFVYTPLIFVDKQAEIPVMGLFGRNLGQRLVAERDSVTLRLGSVEDIHFTQGEDATKKLIDAQSFLKLLGTSAPQELTRTLSAPFMLGVHVFDGNQGFLILETDNYEGAFSGMLAFERNILNDFFGFFGPQLLSHPASGTTTPAFNPAFVDKIIKNHDARALYDETGKMRLVYSFVDRNTLVITTNENTFAEVLTRLQSKRL